MGGQGDPKTFMEVVGMKPVGGERASGSAYITQLTTGKAGTSPERGAVGKWEQVVSPALEIGPARQSAALALTPGCQARWPFPRGLSGHGCGPVLPMDPCTQPLIFDGSLKLSSEG